VERVDSRKDGIPAASRNTEVGRPPGGLVQPARSLGRRNARPRLSTQVTAGCIARHRTRDSEPANRFFERSVQDPVQQAVSMSSGPVDRQRHEGVDRRSDETNRSPEMCMASSKGRRFGRFFDLKRGSHLDTAFAFAERPEFYKNPLNKISLYPHSSLFEEYSFFC